MMRSDCTESNCHKRCTLETHSIFSFTLAAPSHTLRKDKSTLCFKWVWYAHTVWVMLTWIRAETSDAAGLTSQHIKSSLILRGSVEMLCNALYLSAFTTHVYSLVINISRVLWEMSRHIYLHICTTNCFLVNRVCRLICVFMDIQWALQRRSFTHTALLRHAAVPSESNSSGASGTRKTKTFLRIKPSQHEASANITWHLLTLQAQRSALNTRTQTQAVMVTMTI